MKLMIASDIHGSEYYCRLALRAFENSGSDKLLLLGDLLYHGPRNDLPKEYNPKAVISMLNPIADKILAVRGNCEAEVDQMVLSFPVLADYALIELREITIFATHGHLYNQENLPPMAKGTVLLNGHTHIPSCIEHENYVYMNPGSTSIPKEGSCHSYMIVENREFKWLDLESNKKYKTYKV
ncbi:MAG: phosphodiesterase [Hornefia sp.]|nr:phosphodiesterase [Hornefia sp.]